MKKLYSTYEHANDEIANLKWRIYNANNRNRKITSDYGSLPCSVMPELDAAIVVSCSVRATKTDRYVAVYIKI